MNDLRSGRPLLLAAVFAWLAIGPDPALGHADESGSTGHAHSDAYYVSLAQDAEPFVAAANPPPAPEDLQNVGNWGPVIDWPHIPVSAANLPDGRVLTFASNQRTRFPEGPEFTYAAAWDPSTGTITEINHDQHDMFCGHLVMLEDGRVFVNGGRNTVPLTSTFDFQTDSWSLGDSMVDGRWYPTTVYLPDGGVFTAIGDGADNKAEVWRSGTGWQSLLVNIGSIQSGSGYEKNWWPYLHVDPKGKLIHTGPVPNMHRIDPYGTGSIENLGPWMPINGWFSKHAAVTMYAPGKIIIAGGDDDTSNTNGSTNRVLTVDVNGANPVPTEVSPMLNPRRYANAVMLPDGKVLVVGGNTSGEKFSDNGTVLAPELWDPATDTWTTLTEMDVPRNYHSVALLLADGRVFSAGGGLCGCAADHRDAQIYSPPYLYAADGSPAPRPNVAGAPAQVRNGEVFPVTAAAGIDRFTMVKMSATTHAVNTDLRFLDVPFTDEGGGIYQLTAHPSRDVLLPGYWMLFALSNGVPSVGRIIQVSTANAPSVVHPGPLQDVTGELVARQIVASDPNGDPLTWSASGLPPGLSINPNTGGIVGTVPLDGNGSYEVAIQVQDAQGGPTIHVDWEIVPGGLGMGSILREWWLGVPGTDVPSLTAAPSYPDTPSGSDYPTLFEAPSNWAGDYGTRMRAWLHPPVTGDYRFYIASDDNGELWLSSDADPANATLIADVPGFASPREWTKYPGSQDSVLITLQARQPYYIEALQKEGGGNDNLAVGWEIPGSPVAVIDGVYLTPIDTTPPIVPIPNQSSQEGGNVTLQVETTYATGSVSFQAAGLPPGLGIDSATGLISGVLPFGSAGQYTVQVLVQDGVGSDYTTAFGWEVNARAQTGTYPIGETWSGVACWDSAVGAGYLMYSVENVHVRFAADPPLDSGETARNAEHFICVKQLAGGLWNYDTNRYYVEFTPVSTDVLVAAIDFDADTITSLEGQEGNVAGIDLGYASGDLAYFANLWNGSANAGEFTVTGTGFSPNGVNQPPSLDTMSNQTNVELDAVSLTLSATDPDPQPLTYGATGLPAGLSLSGDQISGVLPLGSSGTYDVMLSVTDGIATDEQPIQWLVMAAVCGNGILEAGEACDSTPCCNATTCTFEVAGTGCDDADACTEGETCDGAGTCTPGTPVVCDDGLFCNGAETCDTATGCQPGTPPVIDDGVDCTADSCDEGADAIVNLPDAGFCEDADLCTNFVCDPVQGCVDQGPLPEDAGVCGGAPVPALPPWALGLTAVLLGGLGSLAAWRRRGPHGAERE